MEDEDSELRIGEVLDDKYLVMRRVGAGGMGMVHAAKRIALGDVVAIKSLLRSQNTATNRARFVREAQAAARIRHPNVVQVFDFSSAPQRTPYIVMEYLDGTTLSALLAEQPLLPLQRALTIFGRVCAAVEAGHRRGVVHRDLKPGNVMIARADDGRETIKVLDFGLARMVAANVSAELTQPGALIGTVAYMAPEQVLGIETSAATDIYTLGVILYQLVTGRLPFAADSHVAQMMRINTGEYDDPRAAVPDLPDEVLATIRTALAMDPAARPSSAEALALALGVPVAEAHRGAPPLPPAEPDADATIDRGVQPAGAGPRNPPTTAPVTATGPRTMSDRSLVGRAAALEQIRVALAEACEGHARTIVVVGDAGQGKTTLVDTACRGLAGRGATVLRGQFFGYEGDRPPPYETFERMLASTIVDDDVAGPPAAGTNTSADKWQLFASLAQRFAAVAPHRALVLRLDDLQWSGPSELEFLAYLAHTMADAPLAIVATARPGDPELDAWRKAQAERRTLTAIHLEPWTEEDVRAWLLASFTGLRIRPGDLRRIVRATGGNPHAVTELARLLVARKIVVKAGDGWVCQPLHDIPMPESMQAVLEAQCERLEPRVREILEVACVIGEHFRFETLCLAAQISEDEADAALAAAARVRVVTDRGVAPGSDHRFSSPALRNVLYEGLPARRRVRLHTGVVEALDQLHGADNPRLAHLFSYHLHAIGRWAATLTTSLLGAEHALRAHDVDLIEACSARAEQATGELDAIGEPVDARDRARLDRLHGELANAEGRFEDAEAALRRADARALAAGDRSLALDANIALVQSLLGRGMFVAGVETAEHAAAIAAALGDVVRGAQAAILLASCAGPLGQMDRARAAIEPLLDDASLPPVLQALALREVAWLAAKAGDFAASEHAARAAMHAARIARDAHAEYRAISALGLAYAECGDHRSAIPQLEQALRLARALSQRRREGIELGNLAECRQLSGDPSGALVDASAALDIFVEIGDRASEGDCRVNLGRILVALDRRAEAIAMLEAGRELCAASGRVEYEAIALCELGEIRMAESSPLLARALYERARAGLARIGSALQWRAELGVARVAAAQGATDESHAAARRARDQIDRQLAALPSRVQAEALARARAEIERLLAAP